MRWRKFSTYFVVALFFCVMNLVSYWRMPLQSTLDDGFIYFGWPFSIYSEGGFVTQQVIIWTGLIGDLVLALCTARILTTIFRKVSFPRRRFLMQTSNPVRSVPDRTSGPRF